MPPQPASIKNHKPREWRRQLDLPARMRTDLGWCDISNLNISSRGLLIHAKLPAAEGSLIELRLTATSLPTERRQSRSTDETASRLRGRMFEFLSVGVIVACLALTGGGLVGPALAHPLTAVEAALSD